MGIAVTWFSVHLFGGQTNSGQCLHRIISVALGCSREPKERTITFVFQLNNFVEFQIEFHCHALKRKLVRNGMKFTGYLFGAMVMDWSNLGKCINQLV
ncbi:hypothetical protein V6N12_071635 [Hibiscus sabdariffa]|uniref:Secreted protein n=1 Tax=Hibiscus sabdariffa TaxID=183260 RepID=A0ABR2FKE3_9ROSI